MTFRELWACFLVFYRGKLLTCSLWWLAQMAQTRTAIRPRSSGLQLCSILAMRQLVDGNWGWVNPPLLLLQVVLYLVVTVAIYASFVKGRHRVSQVLPLRLSWCVTPQLHCVPRERIRVYTRPA